MITKRIALYAGVLLCFAVILPTLVTPSKMGRPGLDAFLTGAHRLREGRPVHDASDDEVKPPLATLLFTPIPATWPTWWIERAWDAMNVLLVVSLAGVLARHLARKMKGSAAALTLLGLLFTLNAWNAEIRTGQSDALALVLLLAAGLSGVAPFQGLFAVLAVLLKPTSLLFLPWVWRQTTSKRGLVAGAVTGLVALGALYAWHFGPVALWTDHATWARILPQAVAGRLRHPANLSPMRLFAEAGVASVAGLAAWALGWAVVLWSCRLGMPWIVGYTTAAVASLLLSPLVWTQSFVLCLPYTLVLWADVVARGPRPRRLAAGVALVALYTGLQLYNPTFLGWGLWGKLSALPIPLYALLASLAAYVPASWIWRAWRGPSIPIQSDTVLTLRHRHNF